MKRLLLCMAAFLCLLFIFYRLFFYLDSKAEALAIASHSNDARLTPAEFALIDEGDIILRRGFGFFSDFISENLNKGTIDVTHAGIIIKQHDSLFVVHSLSSNVSAIDGVQIQPLNDFLKQSAPGKIIITRAKNCDSIKGREIANLALTYLNRQIPFDHKGNFDDDNAFFCTEIIWKILEKDLALTKIPLTSSERKKIFYAMDPMYDLQYFDIKVNQYNSIHNTCNTHISE